MAPDQAKAVQHWAEGAWDALDTAQKLVESKKYHHALFFCHLAVEKALKSRYIQATDEMPPYTHDLRLLASRIENVHLSATDNKALATMTAFNVAGRYHDEKVDFYRRATLALADEWMEKTSKLLAILLT